MARLKQESLKVKVAKARKAVKGATKIAGLPSLPSDLEYYRQSDGKIGIREKLSTFKKPKNYPYR